MFSSHVYVHVGASACSTTQYYDELFNGANVICRWLSGRELNFTKCSATAGKREYVLSHAVSE